MVGRLGSKHLVDEGGAVTEGDDLQVAGAGAVEHFHEGVEIGFASIFLSDRIEHVGRTEILV